ncbi:MAG: hypothetical protein KKH28_04805, partial [Elusimicrobia bacterium]|nr:hypothetical protein [Elusimicrobiota bacterium]
WNKKQRELDAEYSGRALGQLAEQEDRFNALLREYHARQEKLEKEAAGKLEETRREYGARLKELEEALQAKEARMRENEELWRRKQLELESGLNAGRNRLNADMLAGEQALAGKEKKLISRNLDLEKEYSAKTAEIENLRIELTRVIMDYKNRK